MAFQDTAGGIVLDATLTDTGRKYMAQGRFKVTKFALGDDEIDYGLTVSDTGKIEIPAIRLDRYPILEAPVDSATVISHGLTDLGSRPDVRFLPEYRIVTNSVPNAVQLYNNSIYLSVNDETTTKLKTAIDTGKYLLQNDSYFDNMLIVESGISSGSALWGDSIGQERYIYNLDLYDQYAFIYCDSRLFDNVLVNQMNAKYENDEADNLYETFQPLFEATKISLPSLIKEQDTYYCRAAKNQVYDRGSMNDYLDYLDGTMTGARRTDYSSIKGPRSNVLALNFVVNKKLNSKSNASPDLRYTKFGKTSVNLFADGNLYDYIDSRLTIEGCMTGRQFQTTIRIIRFSGT